MKIISEVDAKRLDAYLPTVTKFSRNETVRLIEEGKITVNGKSTIKKQSVKAGDEITVIEEPPKNADVSGEDIPLDILYQDEDIAVINKPRGMVVHPAHGNFSGTLVHAILYHIHDLSGINGVLRPGIVHRLDKNTSGLIVIAKNDAAHLSLAAQFKDRTCRKEYLALAEGTFKEPHFTVENYIARSQSDRKKMAVYVDPADGKHAVTEFTVLEQYKDCALVSCLLHTGRTHQIRVHLASVGHPCLGDAEYGFKKQKYPLSGQMLHSWKLSICHPKTGETLSFCAPLPEDMHNLMNILKKC